VRCVSPIPSPLLTFLQAHFSSLYNRDPIGCVHITEWFPVGGEPPFVLYILHMLSILQFSVHDYVRLLAHTPLMLAKEQQFLVTHVGRHRLCNWRYILTPNGKSCRRWRYLHPPRSWSRFLFSTNDALQQCRLVSQNFECIYS
jgi:hypothetical protein